MRKNKEKALYTYPVGREIPLKKEDALTMLDAPTKAAVCQARSRMILVALGSVLFLMLILGKLYYLTLFQPLTSHKSHISLQEGTRFKRKNFLDRNHVVIVTSLATTDLSVNPHKVKNPKEVTENLLKVFPDMTEKDIYDKLTADAKFRYIRRNITPAEKNALNWLGYYFLNEEDGEKRVYPQGALFTHIVGAVDIDNNGVSGLEKGLDKKVCAEDVVLSLDVSIQDIVRKTLEENIKKHQARGGAAVVMDVRTGEVLALVSLPDYNPNFPIPADPDKQFNKATLGVYEFGSVFKLFTVALGLETGEVTPTTVLDAREPLKIGRKAITDFHAQNRKLTVPEVLFHSSNIGSARIALKVGYERQRAFLKQFGFDKTLPLSIPEKADVLFPRQEKWADITVANVSYGYALSVSPLHMVTAVSALVNGGYYHPPTFQKKTGEDMLQYQVLSEETSQKMRAMMWGVLNWDSKKDAIARLYRVGGKTGSANLLEKGKYVEGRVRTTFVGAFPLEDPKIALIVVMEDPKKLKENWYFNAAGWNAKPTGLEMVAKIAPYVGVFPEDIFPVPPYLQNAIDLSKEAKKRR